MKIIKPDTAALLYRTLRFDGRDLLSIGMMAMFDFAPQAGPLLASEADLWKSAAQSLGSDALLDAGLPKPRAEWLAYGAACTPDAKPLRLLSTTVEIGDSRKELYVFGDRHFDMLGSISAAEPFLRMPIDAARAYGGPAFAANPLGRGAEGVRLPSGAVRQPLPNVETPDALIAQARDVRAPAGYWAIPACAPQRAKLLGAFDRQWLADRFPHLPAGTHDDYFCTAPADQRIAGFWRGDEPIVVRNMHPTEPLLRGRLPALRARCFVNRVSGDSARFEECAARAETVWLFPDIARGVILYRAVAAIGDEDADDVTHIVAGWEQMADEPAPIEAYHRLMTGETPAPAEETTLPAEAAATAAVAAAAPVVAAETTAASAAQGGAALPDTPDFAELDKLSAELEAQTQAMMDRYGLTQKDIDAMMPSDTLSAAAAQPPESLDELMQKLDAMTSDLMKQHNLTDADVEKMMASIQESEGADQDAAHLGALGKQLRETHAQTQQMIANSGKTVEQLAAEAGNPELAAAFRESANLDIDDLVASLEALATMLPAAASGAAAMAAPPPPEEEPPAPPPTTRLTREDVLARAATGVSMAGLDLSELDLSDMALEGADFRGAILAGTRFAGSRLAGANLAEASLPEADFAEADLRGAALGGVSARGATFSAARLDGASLQGGDFSAADFSAASLADSNCADALFHDAVMAGLGAAGCNAPKASFERSQLGGADFTRANLREAVFDAATLDDTTFVGADCEDLRLYGTQAAGACFDEANLSGSRSGLAANLSGVSFARAQLARASWIEVDVRRSVFDGSVMEHANFNGVKAVGARFVGVQAKSIQLAKADLSQADLSRANLMNAVLRRARFDGAVLQQSNLYGAQCYGANLGKANLDGTNVDRTLLAIPGRAEAEA